MMRVTRRVDKNAARLGLRTSVSILACTGKKTTAITTAANNGFRKGRKRMKQRYKAKMLSAIRKIKVTLFFTINVSDACRASPSPQPVV
jgi:hypothetical protein